MKPVPTFWLLIMSIGIAAPHTPIVRGMVQLAQNPPSSTCLMNCDTRAGTCEGTCNFPQVAPATTFAAPPGTRVDSGVRTQCIQNCTTQQLTCKQACGVR